MRSDSEFKLSVNILFAFIKSGLTAAFVLVSGSFFGCGQSEDGGLAQSSSLSSEGDAISETSAPASAWFEDVTERSGIDFVNSPPQSQEYFMPASVGAGVAVIDANADGRMDLYLMNQSAPEGENGNCLYIQKSPWNFVEETESFGLNLKGQFHGVACGDLNNDGFPDLILSEYSGIRVLINSEGKKFIDISKHSGVVNLDWGASLGAVDYDSDGWLDIVVANYVKYSPSRECQGSDGKAEFCGPQIFKGSTARLFRNRGLDATTGHVSFVDVTAESGLAGKPGPGLGVVGLDLTGDALTDILFADDMKPNRLFVNQGNGSFKEEGGIRGIAVDGFGQARADMGIAVSDTNRDGLLDIFITHLKGENHTLWEQGPPGVFVDKTVTAKLTKRGWSGTAFGTVIQDFDSDGWSDLVLVNGAVRRGEMESHVRMADHDVETFWRPYSQRGQIFRQTGEGEFEEISLSNSDFCGAAVVGRGLAAADLDNDGAIDLITAPIGSRARIFRNVAEKKGSWLGLSVVLPKLGGRHALGAIVDVYVEDEMFRSAVLSSTSFLCSSDPRVVVGLGDCDAYSQIVVTWPDAQSEVFDGGEVDRYRRLERGAGRIVNE
jgi:hypothetical protein